MTETTLEAAQEQAREEPKRFYTWEQIARDTKLWVAFLWRGMWKTGKGYMRGSLRRTGKGDDRRPDKLEGTMAKEPKWLRSYHGRYVAPAIRQTPRQKRRARAAAGVAR